jgi:hypothetical protein
MNELLSMENNSTIKTLAISSINEVFKLMNKTYWCQYNISKILILEVILVKHYRFNLIYF